VERAREYYSRGRYADALRFISRISPVNKKDAEEVTCLTCECLQFTGEFSNALACAEQAIAEAPRPYLAARYGTVIGRIKLDRQERQQAAEAFRKALRAAERTRQPARFAETHQLMLIAEAENLGAGLLSAVMEAYTS